MKKAITIVVASLILTNSVNAESNIYATLKLSAGSGTESVDYEYGRSTKNSFTMKELSAGFGYIFSNNNKIEFNSNNLDGESNRDIMSLGVDYIFSFDKKIEASDSIEITPEFTLGGRYYAIDDPDNTGVGLKMGVSLVSKVLKDLELGIGIDYNFVDWETEESNGFYGDADISDSMYSFNIFTRIIF